MVDPSLSLSDRLVAACMASFLMALMAVVVPLLILVLGRGRGLEMLGIFGAFYLWGSGLVVFAFASGLVLGIERTTEVLAHLWGTAKPRAPAVSIGLWLLLLAVAASSYWILGTLHAL